jgi:ABC-type proline/glycine betaine transport system permease subunit
MTTQAGALPRSKAGLGGDGVQVAEWVVIALVLLNVVYVGMVLGYLTPNPTAHIALGCEETHYLPTQACYWLAPMSVSGTGADEARIFLPVDTPEAKAGRTFGLGMLAGVALSVYGLARRLKWGNWLAAITAVVAVLMSGRWKTIPINGEGLGGLLSVLFVLSMVGLGLVGVYGVLTRRGWARNLLVLTGAYGTLIGAFWVTVPVSLFQVAVGVLLILLLLERQGGKAPPPLSARIINWTVMPAVIVAVLVITHLTIIAPAEGIAAETLNWRTVFQRMLEHLKVVLVASLLAIATAVPLGILITRHRKFSLRVRRIFTAVPQAVLIGLGYAIPWMVAWWVRDPGTIEGVGDLLRALVGSIFWALLVGGIFHWVIYSLIKARPDWGAIDSWRTLGPVVINIANVGQTVPSLAVLGLSMSFLGIGFTPAIFALWLRALLPILRNTVAGIMAVDQDVIEAARGMGMKPGQVLTRVELPLAMAIIFAGIRTAVVFNVGVGALAFYIGAGGLGHLIAIGIALSLDEVLLAGGILTALMAVAADFLMSTIEERLVPPSV